MQPVTCPCRGHDHPPCRDQIGAALWHLHRWGYHRLTRQSVECYARAAGLLGRLNAEGIARAVTHQYQGMDPSRAGPAVLERR